MTDFIPVMCPYCGETVELNVEEDAGAGSSKFRRRGRRGGKRRGGSEGSTMPITAIRTRSGATKATAGQNENSYPFDDVMLFRRFIEKVFGIRVFSRLLEGRIEKLFFDLRVDHQLPLDLPKKPLPLLDRALRRRIELSQESLHVT